MNVPSSANHSTGSDLAQDLDAALQSDSLENPASDGAQVSHPAPNEAAVPENSNLANDQEPTSVTTCEVDAPSKHEHDNGQSSSIAGPITPRDQADIDHSEHVATDCAEGVDNAPSDMAAMTSENQLADTPSRRDNQLIVQRYGSKEWSVATETTRHWRKCLIIKSSPTGASL